MELVGEDAEVADMEGVDTEDEGVADVAAELDGALVSVSDEESVLALVAESDAVPVLELVVARDAESVLVPVLALDAVQGVESVLALDEALDVDLELVQVVALALELDEVRGEVLVLALDEAQDAELALSVLVADLATAMDVVPVLVRVAVPVVDSGSDSVPDRESEVAVLPLVNSLAAPIRMMT